MFKLPEMAVLPFVDYAEQVEALRRVGHNFWKRGLVTGNKQQLQCCRGTRFHCCCWSPLAVKIRTTAER